MRRTRQTIWLAAAAALAAFSIAAPSGQTKSAAGQAPAMGTIEGTVTDGAGRAFDTNVSARSSTGATCQGNATSAMAGHYEMATCAPGVYALSIVRPFNDPKMRAQRVLGVVVEPGKRTTLDIKLSPGAELEEVGKPMQATQPIIDVAGELARLQAQITELKKQVDALRKQ